LLPNLYIVAVNKLLCSLDGGVIVRAIQIERLLDVVVAANQVGSVMGHVPTSFRRQQTGGFDPPVYIPCHVRQTRPFQQRVFFRTRLKFGRLRPQVVGEKSEPVFKGELLFEMTPYLHGVRSFSLEAAPNSIHYRVRC
jgi:hypothetical protein